ncbi:MAG: type II toxin-antitoxin system RelB/DinJ family antitoxin [Treponema sp.]|nr:type II toxin-antitoxin system RelB/DinJ family antitoxin [Treponema sp.]
MTTISAKIEDSDKDSFENIISSIGLNVTTAITAFVKAVIRENGLPFELKAKDDPYIYSEENLKYLRQAIAQVEGDNLHIVQCGTHYHQEK